MTTLLLLAPLLAFALPPALCRNRLDTNAFLAKAQTLAVTPIESWDDTRCFPPHALPSCEADPAQPACSPIPDQVPGETRTVDVELEPGQPKVPMVYTIQKAPHPATPPKTVVHFTGGPLPSLRLARGNPVTVPDDADLILLEWPGVGANLGVAVHDPDDAYSSAGATRYAEAVIKNEKLGTHGNRYVMYGLSYGSIVATRAAADISKRTDIPKPAAVYLDSIVAHGGLPDTGQHQRDLDLWASLSGAEQASLRKKSSELNKLIGGSTETVDNVLRAALTTPGVPPSDAVAWIARTPKELLLGCAAATARFRAKEGYANEYSAVGRCEFLAKNAPPSTIGGLLPDSLSTECLCSASKLKGSWDAASHVIDGIPAFLRNGKADQLTPLDTQGKYAYQSQSCTRKALCADAGGDHGYFFDNPNLACHKNGTCGQCLQTVWDSVFNANTFDYTRAMHGCGDVDCESANLSCAQTKTGDAEPLPEAADAR